MQVPAKLKVDSGFEGRSYIWVETEYEKEITVLPKWVETIEQIHELILLTGKVEYKEGTYFIDHLCGPKWVVESLYELFERFAQRERQLLPHVEKSKAAIEQHYPAESLPPMTDFQWAWLDWTVTEDMIEEARTHGYVSGPSTVDPWSFVHRRLNEAENHPQTLGLVPA